MTPFSNIENFVDGSSQDHCLGEDIEVIHHQEGKDELGSITKTCKDIFDVNSDNECVLKEEYNDTKYEMLTKASDKLEELEEELGIEKLEELGIEKIDEKFPQNH